MFGGKKNKQVTQIDSLIGQDTVIHGDVKFTGGMHIDGKVIGNITVDEDNTSILAISEQGSVEGEIRVPNIVINGQVTGDVYASERIELALNARINGNVYYNLIEMVIGAAVNGSLVHVEPGQNPPAKPASKSAPAAAKPSNPPEAKNKDKS